MPPPLPPLLRRGTFQVSPICPGDPILESGAESGDPQVAARPGPPKGSITAEAIAIASVVVRFGKLLDNHVHLNFAGVFAVASHIVLSRGQDPVALDLRRTIRAMNTGSSGSGYQRGLNPLRRVLSNLGLDLFSDRVWSFLDTSCTAALLQHQSQTRLPARGQPLSSEG